MKTSAAATILGVLGAVAPCGGAVVSGFVRDPSGAPIAAATMTARTATGRATATTRDDGSFRIDVPGDFPATVRVRRRGRPPVERRVDSADAPVTIVLSDSAADPAAPSIAEQVTVSAARIPRTLAETAAAATIVPGADLERSPNPVLDDALRQIPGFSLFRRSGSRTSNPTSQGVSLRGLGASGTSRALVLDDSIPINDPFGGWVYWSRVPEIAIDRVEVVEGGISDLWGNAALGGIVDLVRRSPEPGLSAGAHAGSEGTAEGTARAAGELGRFRGSLDAEVFTTDGDVPVAPDDRGAVDVTARSRHEALDGTVQTDAGTAGSLFTRAVRYVEHRGNGTPLQFNDTESTEYDAGYDGLLGGGAASARMYRSDELFHQTFSSISADRSSETLVSAQRVPASSTGGSLQWSRDAGDHGLAAGAEGRVVDGTSGDTVFLASGPSFRPSGGRQTTASGWVEDALVLSARWTATAGVRFDSWSNTAGRTFASGQSVALPDRSASAWSPRVSAVFAASETVTITAAAYRAFRAPTLNELYRPFRLGSVQTLANADLAPETLSGVEAGTRYQSRDGRVFARTTVFWADLRNAVGNVTLSSTPALITRERENVGRVRDRGAELAVDLRAAAALTFSAAYLFADSRVVSSANAPDLVGKRVPQVPRDQAALSARLATSAFGLSVQARWSGPQFDDDVNAFRLGSAFTLDAEVFRELLPSVEVFVAGENLTDRENDIGKTPVRTIGPPRAVRAGFRWHP